MSPDPSPPPAPASAPLPLFAPAQLDQLRSAVAAYTVDGVHERLGPAGQAALDRGDLDGARRALAPISDAVATLARLFLLGQAVPVASAARALAPLPLEAAAAAGLIELDVDVARAGLDLRPHAAVDGAQDGPDWWVVSDLGNDVRPGPLAGDHVLGVGSASVTLAQATVRGPVERALDIGTGCGIQALHLSRHARSVTGTDISARALRFAATTAALSGQHWELRPGSLLEPVGRRRFDLIVANPPFVVSPFAAQDPDGLEYRDSEWDGDQIAQRLLHRLPGQLAPGGAAQLLANWCFPSDGDWAARVSGWLPERGCDAWIWQREIADPGEYVSLWLRDAGEQPGTARWRRRYDRWLDWFADSGVAAVGMGLVTLWRHDEDRADIRVCEDLPQAVEQPVGPHIAAWIERARWLAGHDLPQLLDAALRAGPDLALTRLDTLDVTGWRTRELRLSQGSGLRWEVASDAAVSGLVAGADGTTPLRVLVDLLAAGVSRSSAEVAQALEPVVRDLLARGFLLPPAEGAADHSVRPPSVVPGAVPA